MRDKALDYAMQSCNTMMRKFNAEDLPPKGRFHYHQGVFLSGMYQTYLLCNEEKYFDYIKSWIDSCMDGDGNVLNYSDGQLDDIQPAILLYPLLERTQDEKYKNAIKERIRIIDGFPKNKLGGFWHKDLYPEQMWLDGLYMAGPFCAEYAHRFNKPEYFNGVAEQALLMREKTIDEKTGLWYHAWDCSGNAEWSDKETGQSSEFWGRSMGWVPVAVLNELDFLPMEHERFVQMCELVRQLLISLCKYQTESGLWYQVVNKSQQEGNWPEISCSCLYTAAIYKAVRNGILGAEYLEYADRGFNGVCATLKWQGDDLIIGGVCVGTGVGDYEYYCKRPISENDLHGVGAFLIMCTEAAQNEVTHHTYRR